LKWFIGEVFIVSSLHCTEYVKQTINGAVLKSCWSVHLHILSKELWNSFLSNLIFTSDTKSSWTNLILAYFGPV